MARLSRRLWGGTSLKTAAKEATCFYEWLNATKFVNNSLFGKNKAITIAKRLSPIFFLTGRSHGNLIGTPTEYNLGLIVLLSTNQN